MSMISLSLKTRKPQSRQMIGSNHKRCNTSHFDLYKPEHTMTANDSWNSKHQNLICKVIAKNIEARKVKQWTNKEDM